MATNIASDVTSKPRDADFYFTLITFEVENVLFRVPRHPFETESEVFKDMFTLPATTDPSADGTSDEKPLILHGIAAQDFHALLRVLFGSANGRQEDMSQKEWTSVLHLSHMWNFNRLLHLAIEKLHALPVDPVSKITLAKSYGITSWLRPAHFDLAMRTDPLTLEEADKLGMECTVKLGRVREFRYRWIIEDGDLQSAPPTPVYHKKKDKKPFMSYSYETTVSEHYIAQLEHAVHGALTEVFGLE